MVRMFAYAAAAIALGLALAAALSVIGFNKDKRMEEEAWNNS